MKISIPIIINIIPPKIVALLDKTVPNFFPIKNPTTQIIKAIKNIITDETNAIKKL